MNRMIIVAVAALTIMAGSLGAIAVSSDSAPVEAATAITCKYSTGSGQIRYSSEWNGRRPPPTPTAGPGTPTPTATPIPWCRNADPNAG